MLLLDSLQQVPTMKKQIVTLLAGLLMAGPAFAHDTLTLEDLVKQFGWNFDKAEIRSERVAENLYVLFGLGGNIGVSIGEDGVLVVDDQFPQLIPQIRETIARLGGGKIDFAVNTHWHFDHAEGNLALGPAGTWIVSQSNSRAMMLEDRIINLVAFKYEQKAYPKAALPHLTFDDKMQMHFNDEHIEFVHYGPAHTTGDAAVIFRGSNAVHMGDVFNRGYPFIDADSGGGINGMINFCQRVLDSISADTIVIPGHGEVSDANGLRRYIRMLTTVRDRVQQGIDAGQTFEQVLGGQPTAEFNAEYGDPRGFIDRVFVSLSRQ